MKSKSDLRETYFNRQEELYYIQEDKSNWGYYNIQSYEEMVKRVNELNKEVRQIAREINT